jgi:hypothetical protein
MPHALISEPQIVVTTSVRSIPTKMDTNHVPPPPAIVNNRKRKDLTQEQRTEVVRRLLLEVKEGAQNFELRKGALLDVARSVGVVQTTVGRIWKRSLQRRSLDGDFQAALQLRKGRCGRPQKWNREELMEAINVPQNQQRSLRELVSALGVPKTTLHRMRQRDKEDSNAIQPHGCVQEQTNTTMENNPENLVDRMYDAEAPSPKKQRVAVDSETRKKLARRQECLKQAIHRQQACDATIKVMKQDFEKKINEMKRLHEIEIKSELEMVAPKISELEDEAENIADELDIGSCSECNNDFSLSDPKATVDGEHGTRCAKCAEFEPCDGCEKECKEINFGTCGECSSRLCDSCLDNDGCQHCADDDGPSALLCEGCSESLNTEKCGSRTCDECTNDHVEHCECPKSRW